MLPHRSGNRNTRGRSPTGRVTLQALGLTKAAAIFAIVITEPAAAQVHPIVPPVAAPVTQPTQVPGIRVVPVPAPLALSHRRHVRSRTPAEAGFSLPAMNAG